MSANQFPWLYGVKRTKLVITCFHDEIMLVHVINEELPFQGIQVQQWIDNFHRPDLFSVNDIIYYVMAFNRSSHFKLSGQIQHNKTEERKVDTQYTTDLIICETPDSVVMDNPSTATQSHECCENRIERARINYDRNLTVVTRRRNYIDRDNVDSIWTVRKLYWLYNLPWRYCMVNYQNIPIGIMPCSFQIL